MSSYQRAAQDWEEEARRHRQAVDRAFWSAVAAHNAPLLDQADPRRLVEAVCSYAGSGDEGGIEEIAFHNPAGEVVVAPEGLDKAARDWFSEKLDENEDVDFNGDGCSGEVRVDLATREVSGTHRNHYTAFDESTW